MKKLLFLALLLYTSLLSAQDITGSWYGTLEVSGVQLRIVFHIEKTGDSYSALLDSPDQGAKGLPTTSTTFVDRQLNISIDNLDVNYAGALASDEKTIEGIFEQAGQNLVLNLSREAGEKKVTKRPQEPEVFPYAQEEVVFINIKGGHTLAGTLTKPSNGKFEQVVVLISGSGPQDRNEDLGLINHRPFLVLSDYLTRQGIAVLRYDDRGVANSKGDFSTGTTRDFADDAAAAVTFLKTRSDTKNKKLGLVGHSEGGLIAPMVAIENQAVDFIVLLAGPGIPSDQLLLLQSDKIAEVNGVDAAIRMINKEISSRAFIFIKSNPDLDEKSFRTKLEKILSDGYKQLPTEEQTKIGSESDFVQAQVTSLMTSWLRYFIQMNPDDYLSKVTCPVLAINGSLDLQVPAKENLDGIAESLKKAGNSEVTIKTLAELNHLFQKANTGSVSEYGSLEETFNEEAMQVISDWILR